MLKRFRPETLEDMYSADLADENDAIKFYTTSARTANEDDDVGTRVLFENIMLDEEGHMDWLSRQLSLLERMGEPTYTAQNISNASK